MIRLLKNREIYTDFVRNKIRTANNFLWIATADIKDMYVESGNKFVPFLQIISNLISEAVNVRLIHAKEPGPRFREDFDKYPNLIDGLERMLCPRVHFKSVVIDGRLAYTGSANLTGAGMGAKGSDKRNFENGILTDNSSLIEEIMEQFDSLWIGNHCETCKRKNYCSDYRDIV